MINELMKDFKGKLDEIEGLLESDLLTKKERRFIRTTLMVEQQRMSAMAMGVSEEVLLSSATKMMQRLLK